jgi:hypothetical protein
MFTVNGRRHAGTATLKEITPDHLDAVATPPGRWLRIWKATTHYQTRSLKRAYDAENKLLLYRRDCEGVRLSGDGKTGMAFLRSVCVTLEPAARVAIVTSEWEGTGPLRDHATPDGGDG